MKVKIHRRDGKHMQLNYSTELENNIKKLMFFDIDFIGVYTDNGEYIRTLYGSSKKGAII